MYLKRLNTIFRSMKDRCNNPANKCYYLYGERGISVCKEWNTPGSRKGWNNFREWALLNGYTDELTLDRINNDKGYSPENCRWATVYEQANNKRSNHLITYKGRTQTLAQWCTELHLNYWTTRSRLYRDKISVEQAFSTNENTRLKFVTYKGKRQSLKKWCVELGLNYYTTVSRINRNGWSVEKAFEEPTRHKCQNCKSFFEEKDIYKQERGWLCNKCIANIKVQAN
ncbi:MAG: hypothetical protein J6S85_20035 [Methanobrevibacter sp.]|nr:hypothetical protein [Methanobrevibacter sp.]